MRLAFALSLAASVASGLAAPLPALANDGFGGLSATGLSFGQTEAVVMQEEDLYIGIDRIAVDYVFRNTTAQDVTGEVIFPLPPVAVWSQWDGMMNLPEDVAREDLVDFRVTVAGQPVAVQIDRIAVIEPPWDENRPMAAQYDTPGREVTADLARFGLPLTLDVEVVRAALLALSPARRAEVQALGLAEYYGTEGSVTEPLEVWSQWSLVWRYHWTQTFPAGADLRISHTYENLPPGGVFYWSEPPEDYQAQLADQYCIDGGTSRAIAKALKNPQGDEFGNYGTAYNLSYVLRTANSWAGPIGKFRLTLDKGDPGNVISLCAEGVKKTGPTTFVVEKTNYTPLRDLEVLVVVPMPKG
ncbi:MAG: DUF4424 family protein [Paracoccaceae bacterium]|jgi:hypothetical protein